MKKFSRVLLMVGIMLQLSFLPVYGNGFWKIKMAISERNAAEYIHELKAGAQPGSLKRPEMRHDKEYEAEVYVKELNKAMDEAERLARLGKNEQIKEPELRFPPPKKSEY